MRWLLRMTLGCAASSCCIVPGHDVRDFFTGSVTSTKPTVSKLAGRYVISIDRREGVTTPASVTLQLNADGSLTAAGDLTTLDLGISAPVSQGSGDWKLEQADSDRVWCVRINVDVNESESAANSWYVLRMKDGSVELGAFQGDPDSGNVVQLKRTTSPSVAATQKRDGDVE